MKFKRAFTLLENKIATGLTYRKEGYTEYLKLDSVSDDEMNLNRSLSIEGHNDGKGYMIKQLLDIIKKNGDKGNTKSGIPYWMYSVIVPEVHEGLKLNDGKKVVFLYVDGENEIQLFKDQNDSKTLQALETEAKKVLNKYKTNDLKNGEEEHPVMKVGTILYSSWGYDQTNVDWYVVVKSNKTTAWLNEINDIRSGSGDMTGTTKPDTKNMNMKLTNKTLQKKIQDRNGNVFIKLSSFSFAYVWDGNPKRYSTYA